MRRDGAVFAVGAIGLGLIGLAFGDFALQWQPVAQGIPARHALALVSGLALVVAGGAVFWRRSAGAGALALAVMYGLLWSVVLKAPALIARPLEAVSWLGVAETLAMAAGGLTLAAMTLPPGPLESRTRLWARIVFGVCPLIFGICHFVYPGFTAAMVPAWIPPGGLFWAWATGLAHVAGGLAILARIQERLAATLLAVMYGGFALLLHAPRVVAAPTTHIEWVMLGIATSLSGAAWAIRAGMNPAVRPWGVLDRRAKVALAP